MLRCPHKRIVKNKNTNEIKYYCDWFISWVVCVDCVYNYLEYYGYSNDKNRKNKI